MTVCVCVCACKCRIKPLSGVKEHLNEVNDNEHTTVFLHPGMSHLPKCSSAINHLNMDTFSWLRSQFSFTIVYLSVSIATYQLGW